MINILRNIGNTSIILTVPAKIDPDVAMCARSAHCIYLSPDSVDIVQRRLAAQKKALLRYDTQDHELTTWVSSAAELSVRLGLLLGWNYTSLHDQLRPKRLESHSSEAPVIITLTNEIIVPLTTFSRNRAKAERKRRRATKGYLLLLVTASPDLD